MTARWSATGLSVAYHRRPVLDGLSLTLSAGRLTALLGRNGAGKTTLIRCLLGLLNPDAGVIHLDGAPLRSLGRPFVARQIAYVPQAHATMFPFKVREIVGMGRAPVTGVGARLGPSDEAAVSAALDRLGLLDFADRNFAELSGGERQAVLIARAFAQEARILIMDEPVASLDIGQQIRLMGLLRGLADDGYAVLLSLHQPELALQWCDGAVLLKDGRVLAEGPPGAVITDDTLTALYGVRLSLAVDRRVVAGT
jgi:iron complex transport system ATP-binding protein